MLDTGCLFLVKKNSNYPEPPASFLPIENFFHDRAGRDQQPVTSIQHRPDSDIETWHKYYNLGLHWHFEVVYS
jgi:hypothetical protein